MAGNSHFVYRPTAAQQQRERDVDRIHTMTGKVFRLSGFISLDGPGETLANVVFPVTFQEIPAVSSSYHLADNEILESGNFPVVSVGVKSWVFTEPVPGTRFYTGATMIVVALGHAGMKAVAHYQFEGKALVNPVTALNNGLG
jgi:hypothetical protein